MLKRFLEAETLEKVLFVVLSPIWIWIFLLFRFIDLCSNGIRNIEYIITGEDY